MKKLLATTLVGLIAGAFMLTTAQAENNANFDNIVAKPQVVVNYQGSENNPFKTLVNDITKKITRENLLDLSLKDIETMKLTNDILISNNVSIVLVNEEADLGYALFEINNSNFQKFLDLVMEYEGLSQTDFNETTIYSSYKRDEFAFAHHNGSLFLTDTVENLSDVLTSLNSGSADLSDMTSKMQSDSFFSIMIFDDFMTSLAGVPAEEALFSLSETKTDNFELITYTKGDKEAFDAHNFSYDMFTFTPSLYEVMPDNNLSLYVEANDLVTFLEKILEMSDMDFVISESEMERITNNPFYKILDVKSAISMSFKSNNVMPEITLITENSNSELARSANDEINKIIEDSVYDEELNLNTGDIRTFERDLTANMTESERNKFPELSSFKLTYGQIEDFYVVSNNSNIEVELNSSPTLADNSKFTETFGSKLNSKMILTYSYFDPSTIAGYIDYIQNKTANEMDAQTANTITTAKELFEETDPWYSYSIADDYETTETAVFNLPISKLSELLISTMETKQSIDRNYAQYRFSDVDFETAWYAKDLEKAYEAGIVHGKTSDDDFGLTIFDPSAPATRAEFITMLLRHYDLEYANAPLGSQIFDDVDAGSWYDYNMGIAYEYGLIQGDEGTSDARPNDTISRAEAVQILANYSGVLYGLEGESFPFKDTSPDKWYTPAVAAAAKKGIVTGTTPETFEPSKNLNRAEAIALINRIRENEFRPFELLVPTGF